jgi:hypothetical protein
MPFNKILLALGLPAMQRGIEGAACKKMVTPAAGTLGVQSDTGGSGVDG